MINNYGSVLHFFEYSVDQCRKRFKYTVESMERVSEGEEKVINVVCISADKKFTICCNPANRNNEDTIFIRSLIESKLEDPDSDECDIASLKYNKITGRFSDDSYIGNFNANKMLEGKHPNISVSDVVYKNIIEDKLSIQAIQSIWCGEEGFHVYKDLKHLIKKQNAFNKNALNKSNITIEKPL